MENELIKDLTMTVSLIIVFILLFRTADSIKNNFDSVSFNADCENRDKDLKEKIQKLEKIRQEAFYDDCELTNKKIESVFKNKKEKENNYIGFKILNNIDKISRFSPMKDDDSEPFNEKKTKRVRFKIPLTSSEEHKAVSIQPSQSQGKKLKPSKSSIKASLEKKNDVVFNNDY